MAIAFVRSVQAGTSGGATSTIGFGVASTAGNTLVLQVSTAIGRPVNGGDPYVSVTSNVSGTTFVRVSSNSILQSGIYYEHSQIWVASNVPADTHTVTVNAGTGAEDYGQLFLTEFSGLANVSAVDLTANKTGDSQLGQFDTTINVGTTAQSDELILASFSGGGGTNLNDYYTTEIVNPTGFTQIALDTNARQGHRALSQSYKIVNTIGPQSVSWGTVADPGPTEKMVWAANVATLRALVSGLIVPGVTLTAPASLLTGTATAVRRGTPAGQVLSRTASLLAGTGLGGKNAVAAMAGGFTLDSTNQPTFDQTSGYTFDNTATSDGVLTVNASLLAGNGIGIPINITGSAVLTANSAFVVGAATSQRQSSNNGVLYSRAASLLSGTVNAQTAAQASGISFTATGSLIAGQGSSFNNAVVNGVAFTAYGSIAPQNLTFTFDSTNQPTFDQDSGYTFDAATVAASQTALPFGAIFSRQASLLVGSVSANRLGIASGAVLAATANIQTGNVAVVDLNTIPGAVFASPASLVRGAVSAQNSEILAGFIGLATTSIITGNATPTVNASAGSAVLPAAASFVAGSVGAQTSKTANGIVFARQASLIGGTASTTVSTTLAPALLVSNASILFGGVAAQRNINIGFSILTATANLLSGGQVTQQGQIALGYAFGALASLSVGDVSANKNGIPAGRLFVVQSTLLAGGVNGLENLVTPGQTLTVNTSYVPPTAFAIQSVQHSGQTYVVRPELLAGQATPAVNAIVNGQTLAASATMAEGNVVYFAAVTVLSQTIAAQSAFIVGTVVGKQLTRRNTGGRAFYFLQEFLQPIVGQELIFSEQNGPRPAKPYATLSVRSISEQEIIQHHLNANGIISLAKLQRMIVEVEYFGLGAFSKAQVLGIKLQSPSNVDRGDAFGISVSQLRGVTRVPELLNQSQYEERAILEFTAYIMVEGDDDVGLIEHAIIQDTDADHACNFDFVYEGSN